MKNINTTTEQSKLKPSMKTRPLLDGIGIFLSGLCVLHCLMVPLFLFFAPQIFLNYFPDEDLTHVLLLAFILGVAGVAFVTGYRQHGQIKPIIWMMYGMFFIVYATYFVHDHLGHVWEPIIAITGSLALIRAHYLNHRHCKLCDDHHLDHHHEELNDNKCSH